MAVHWVNYDLNKTGKDYEKLIEHLKSYPSWLKPLKSSFFIKTSLSAADVRDAINKHIDSDDDVVVVRVDGRGWAAHGLSKDDAEWLRQNL